MACTLAWAVKLLSNNPEVQYKLRDQLVNTLPSLNERSPTFSDLKVCSSDLGYLDATCFEILRCGKVLGEVSRTSRVDTMVMGHVIPKDTVVMMPHSRLSGPQQSESEFRPERWIDCDGKFDAQLPGPLHVFGHGQRGCFGKNLAVSTDSSNIFHSFSRFLNLLTLHSIPGFGVKAIYCYTLHGTIL
jgi:cytochrome P450